jgi:hypothetical protein
VKEYKDLAAGMSNTFYSEQQRQLSLRAHCRIFAGRWLSEVWVDGWRLEGVESFRRAHRMIFVTEASGSDLQ